MATYTTSRTITAALLAIALAAPGQPSPATAELAPPVFAGESDAAAYAWSQELFAAAGFTEPTVTIEFSTDGELCGGALGRTWFTEDELATIAVCATHDNPMVEEAHRRRALLHELAHAWVDQNVSAERIAAFIELRGLEEWSSREVEWADRAVEHAAETFTWGIQGGDYRVDVRIDNTDCPELAAGYELLTGTTIACELDPA
jgi:hypothetical protein